MLASPSPDADTPRRARPLADPPASALRVPTPVPLARGGTVSHWAPVRQAVGARARPGGGATVARLATRTPEGTQNLVLVLRRAFDGRGRLWLEARLAAGTAGWVPRAALGGLHAVHTRLVVDRARREATLSRDGRELLRVPVGVGGPKPPTPAGGSTSATVSRDTVARIWTGGLWDERPLPDHGLAGRRLRGHSRHEPARPAPRPGIPRLHTPS